MFFVNGVTSVLPCFPLPSSHILDNWEKCALTPQSWSVTLRGPGQHCGTSAPWSRTIWFEGRDFQSWVMDQWSASCLAFWDLFFLSPWWFFGGWESTKTTNKEVTSANNKSSAPLGNFWGRMFDNGLLKLKETISHNMCRERNSSLTSHGAGMSLH